MDPQDKSFTKITPLLNSYDPFVITSLFSVAAAAKSTGIALALIVKGNLALQDALNIARCDENFQTKHFGVVEGAHDFDEAHTLTTFATAKTLVNFC